MISISIAVLVLWLIVGGLNLARCITKRECSWLDYWLLYVVLIINLIDEIFKKLI